MKFRMMIFSLFSFSVFGWTISASAIDFSVTGAEVTIDYTEPTKNSNTAGTPLTDLARTNVYFQLDAGAAVKGSDVPASAPTGGGQITTKVTLPVTADQEVTATIWATATDLSGNESVPSAKITKRIDRLAPSAPQ